jgi:hypothetical protein
VSYNANATNAIVQLATAGACSSRTSTPFRRARAAGAAARVFVSDSVFERNAPGASVTGTGAELTLSSNVVTGSNNGVAARAVIYTRQNNTVRGNTSDLGGTPYINLGGS